MKTFVKLFIILILLVPATLAAEMFDRHSDYDPHTDPIVGIRLDRLRRALDRYYQGNGKKDRLRIDIPQNSFVPTFTNQSSGD